MDSSNLDYYHQTEVSFKESAVELKKFKQKKSILNALYINGKMAISDLSESLFISIPTLTSHIEELLTENWLVGEELDNKKQGRRPTIYSLNPQWKHVIVIDITTHDTKIFVLNFNNEIIHQEQYNLKLTAQSSFLLELFKLIETTIHGLKSQDKEIISIGITIPGLVNKRTGINRTYKNLNFENKSLSLRVSENFKLPVFTLNDSKAAAYGEAKFGVGKNLQHVLSINVDWGVGLGVVFNGQIFNGSSGFAGELGHIQVNPEGELCGCGKVGCLDTVTSASSLLKSIKAGLKNGQISILSEYKDKLEQINLEMVIEAAKNGDAFAIDILYNIGIELGKGLSVAVHLFNPQIIVIDGVLSKAGKIIVNPVEHAINKYCLPDFKDELLIEVTNLGDFAKILGVNAFMANRLFKND
ncbi:MAG: ROK family transcriptional regulator [Leadbetterella sp.]|jgi:glucokinase-like ROK family protein|nr:ROK family transcriptional regulator [Leadbetterella sp.]